MLYLLHAHINIHIPDSMSDIHGTTYTYNIYTYLYIYTYIYIYVCVCVCVCVCVYVCVTFVKFVLVNRDG